MAHASWRAIIRSIIRRVIEIMKNKFGSQEKDILVGVGPKICSCHFEVQEDVATKFSQKVLIKRKNRLFIDLPLAIKLEVIKNGIRPKNIEEIKECTYCLKNKYFFFRRAAHLGEPRFWQEKPKELKAMMALIGVKKLTDS